MSHHTFSADEISKFRAEFRKFDLDNNGNISESELSTVLRSLGENVPDARVREMIAEVDTNGDGQISFDEFLTVVERLRKGNETAFASVVKKAGTLNVMGGATEGTQHAFTDDEKEAFVDWINDCLGKDAELRPRMPIPLKGAALFEACQDGVLLCKLINSAVADTVDERAMNLPSKKKLNIHLMAENNILAINSARAIGCAVVNIGPNDLYEGRAHLIMGLIWQIIRIGLLSCINLKNHPELYRLLNPGETIEDLLKLGPEAILLRWVNYHLKEAGSARRVNNFSGDIKDSEVYTLLLKQIAPKSANVDTNALGERDLTRRAEMVLVNADKIGCKKFVRPNNIVHGHPKLNLAFVANLFNHYPALEPVVEVVVVEETREEKTFRNWMNSLGVEPFVGNLYEDLKDGLVLIQLFDKVQPGIVNWKRVNRPPYTPPMTAPMKKLENCNYAVELGKQIKFSLVGIAGSNVNNGDKTPILAIVWQLMRAHVFSILNALSTGDKRIQDAEVLEWVNARLREAGKPTVSSYKDPSIATSRPVADLLDAVKPGSVDWEHVGAASTPEEQLSNAKYIISIARKTGAVVFCLPEDIVEVKPKMMLTLFAGIMAVGMGVAK
eukprot:m51a1_g10705 putative actin bundling protein (612) ;mRNA; f:168336-170949